MLLRERLVDVMSEISLARVTTVSEEEVEFGSPGLSAKVVRVVDAGVMRIGDRVLRKSTYAGGGVRGVFCRLSSNLIKVGVPAAGVRSSEGKLVEVAETGVLRGASCGFSAVVVAMVVC